jgi:hypothetical protein
MVSVVSRTNHHAAAAKATPVALKSVSFDLGMVEVRIKFNYLYQVCNSRKNSAAVRIFIF